jgi:sugar lactone lactonase YvrE
MLRFLPIFLIFFFFSQMLAQPQDLRIGDWKSYLPYKFGLTVTQSPEAVFYGTTWSVLKVNKTDLSLEFFSKVEGLNDIEVQLVEYSLADNVLIIVYRNSNIDLVFEDEIINLDQIKINAQIVKSRIVHDIFVQSPFAYLATGFGLVQLNIQDLEFGFTTFTENPVTTISRNGDKLVMGTAVGLYTAKDDGSVNLADFSVWEKLGTKDGLPEDYNAYSAIHSGSRFYVGINDGIYVYNSGIYNLVHREPGFSLDFLIENGNEMLTGWACQSGCNSKKVLIRQNGAKKVIPEGCANRAKDAVVDEAGRVWYADDNIYIKFSDGFEGSCSTINPDRPDTHLSSQLAVHDRKLYVAAGGVTPNYGYLFRTEGFYTNEDGNWKSINKWNTPVLDEKDMRDFLTIAISSSGIVYVGTFWDGLIEYNAGNVTVFDQTNSTLQNSVLNPQNNRITDLSFDDDGNLWMSNHDAPKPLSVLTKDGVWLSFATTTPTNIEKIEVDKQGYVWMSVGGVGLLLFDPGGTLDNSTDDRYRLFNSNNSALTVNDITAIETDEDGAVWVGTTSGPVLFDCGSFAFDQNCQGIRLIVEERGIAGELLGEENIRAIAIDGGNRKWFGTNNGVFVQSADAETQVAHFDQKNSPLFDNGIVDIAIDALDGEVFIATNKGIISVRGEATVGNRFHNSNISVFPNPVRPQYDGPIAIKGLAQNANVKITDIQGKLVFETRAIGGQAIWYGEDLEGRKINSGVYLVFSTALENFSNPDGAITKIMFIR